MANHGGYIKEPIGPIHQSALKLGILIRPKACSFFDKKFKIEPHQTAFKQQVEGKITDVGVGLLHLPFAHACIMGVNESQETTSSS